MFSVSDVLWLKKKPILFLPNSCKALQRAPVTFNLSLASRFSGCLLNNSSYCLFYLLPQLHMCSLRKVIETMACHLVVYLCSLNRQVSRDQTSAYQPHKCNPKPGDISELRRSSLAEQVFVAHRRKRGLG